MKQEMKPVLDNMSLVQPCIASEFDSLAILHLSSTLLIIGAAGFVGNHLLRLLSQSKTLQITTTKLPHEDIDLSWSSQEFRDRVKIENVDICNSGLVLELIQNTKPDYIIHLAAQSSVGLSFAKPALTMEINLVGTTHLLEAIRSIVPQAKTLLVGSAEQYGKVEIKDLPIKETQALSPISPYAISKQAAEALAQMYVQSYDLSLICVRAFNHIGPGQLPAFVVSDFAKQIAQIEKGDKEAVLRVGNLSARRDFTDVRDIVVGYLMLLQSGKIGQTYNIGSGKSYEIQFILDYLMKLSSKSIEVVVDPSKFRPVEVLELRADISRIIRDTDWKPQIPIEKSLEDAIDLWRIHV